MKKTRVSARVEGFKKYFITVIVAHLCNGGKGGKLIGNYF